jgi:gamma-glutamylcyclotransferase (GGCT)/AIG2-like uncharacterized protein YtfP
VELLFVYGTLKEPEVQSRVIGRIIKGIPDTLNGYTKSTITINNNTYPIISQGEGNVEGLILEVTTEELKKLDEYETSAYKRKKVTLKSGKEAWAYQK